MNTLSPYTVALLLSEGKFSCAKASKRLGFASHDALTRQLTRPWEYGVVTDWSKLPEAGDLVFDDTTIGKPYSRKIANVHWVYDASEQKALPGYKLLLVLWVTKTETHILRVCLPGTENMNELMRQTLKELSDAGLKPRRVLFDCWFATNATLNLLHRLGWTYVCRVKSNRLFNKKHINEYSFRGAKGKIGKLKGVAHRVQIVKDGDRYLVTNKLIPHTTISLSRTYQERWVIEQTFRDLKQVVHLEKCACRSLEA